MVILMMPNLFSIFDPTTSTLFSMNWISIFTPLMFSNLKFWLTNSRTSLIWMLLLNNLFMEFKILLKKMKINIIIFVSLMNYLLMMNLLSLFPYIFTPTSHMSLNLTLSLTLWLSFMIYGWINFYDNMLIHLVPLNTPMFLMNFMVLIETISNIIRPWTLSIRLTANMLAGHLLILLLSSSINNTFFMLIPLIMFIQIILLTLEISVSFIQSYVFSILSLLYMNESNY